MEFLIFAKSKIINCNRCSCLTGISILVKCVSVCVCVCGMEHACWHQPNKVEYQFTIKHLASCCWQTEKGSVRKWRCECESETENSSYEVSQRMWHVNMCLCTMPFSKCCHKNARLLPSAVRLPSNPFIVMCRSRSRTMLWLFQYSWSALAKWPMCIKPKKKQFTYNL